MINLLQTIRDWSEAWALLIPLAILLFKRPRGKGLRWIYAYVILGFLLNFIATFLLECGLLLPQLAKWGNNLYYNLHSLVMVICFSLYILPYIPGKYKPVSKILLVAYLVFVVIHFSIKQNPLLLSSLHFAIGSTVLIVIYLFYFFGALLEEKTDWLGHPTFIISAGLCLYEVVTFFIFLFIYPLFNRSVNSDLSFAMLMMRLYQGIFILFCILLAIGLNKYSRKPGTERAA